jgi:NADH-quinone oxidoreductase subunit L
VQTDIKKVLAYSTVSQLGFMMLGVGVAAYSAAIFHLITHAFFKALLFLAAGSVMHGLHGETDMRKMGGLRSHMPQTYYTFLIGSAVLAGLPLLSGFFSKDAILLNALIKSPALYVVGILTALLTAVYAFRATFLTFLGQPRDKKLVEHSHESPPLMTIELWILAVLSIVGGIIDLPFILPLDHFLEPVIEMHSEHPLNTEIIVLVLSGVVALLGLWIAWQRYLSKRAWAVNLDKRFKWLQPALEHKWYFDEFYTSWIVNPLKQFAGWCAAFFDARVVDGAVNGLARVTGTAGEYTRRLQNGYVPTYALSILIGVVALVVYFLVA